MRIVALAFVAALVAGCNVITSSTPLFSAADTEGQPQPRPGLWMSETSDCAVDTDKPVDDWPRCADAWVARPGAVLAGRDPGSSPSTWTIYRTRLARGDPAVLQIAIGEAKGDDQPAYVYAGLKPLKFDGQGAVIEYKVWPALCGPPPEQDPTGRQSATATQRPIDGLVMDKANQDCIARSPAPVRVSARESEAWAGEDNDGRDRARWVRDAER